MGGEVVEQVAAQDDRSVELLGQHCELVMVDRMPVRQEAFTPELRRHIAPFAGYITVRRERIRINAL